MFRRGPIVWSPVELDWLKANRNSTSIDQMSVALAKSRAAVKRKMDELDGKVSPSKKSSKRTKIGKREDILVDGNPLFLRSGWEANVARWLTSKGKKWEYEPKVFFYDKVRRGTNSYTPDFRYDGLWLEVKGNLNASGRAALRRFKKYYPDEFAKLRAITGSPKTKASKFFEELGVPIIAYYNDLHKKYRKEIKNWE